MFTKLFSSLLLLAVSIVPALSDIVTYTNVAYGSDPDQVMDIYVPAGKIGHSNPTIILIHGGAWIGGDKADLSSIAQYFTEQGYTVANINYRLATPTSNQYPAAVDDTETVVNFLQRNSAVYRVDKGRIAAFGTSAGANLALTLGTEGLVDSVVDFYGPADLSDPVFLANTLNGESNTQIVETYLGFSLAENPALYANASPINNLSAVMPPTIIFHGSDDQVVPVEQSEDLYRKLQILGVISTLNIEAGLGHGFLTSPGYDQTPVLQQCVTFLKTNMR